MSETPTTPEGTPQQALLDAINDDLSDRAVIARGGIPLDGDPTGLGSMRTWLDANHDSLDPTTANELANRIDHTAREEYETINTRGEAALGTMSSINYAGERVVDMMTNLRRMADEGQSIDPRWLANWLEGDLMPDISKASQQHEIQSEGDLARYRATLPQDQQRDFRNYQRVQQVRY